MSFDPGTISCTSFTDRSTKMQSWVIRGKEENVDYGKSSGYFFFILDPLNITERPHNSQNPWTFFLI